MTFPLDRGSCNQNDTFPSSIHNASSSAFLPPGTIILALISNANICVMPESHDLVSAANPLLKFLPSNNSNSKHCPFHHVSTSSVIERRRHRSIAYSTDLHLKSNTRRVDRHNELEIDVPPSPARRRSLEYEEIPRNSCKVGSYRTYFDHGGLTVHDRGVTLRASKERVRVKWSWLAFKKERASECGGEKTS